MKKYILIILVICCVQINAQTCYPNYAFFRTVTLTSSNAIDAHTVAITWNTKELVENNKLKADGSDLRITDNACNDLPFFVQGFADRDTNVIYIAIADIPLGGLEIEMYYGQSSPQTSMINGNAVFDFFDDFEDGITDPLKWETVGAYATWEEVDGKMRYLAEGGFRYITTAMSFDYPISCEFSALSSGGLYHYGFANSNEINKVGLRYSTGFFGYDTLDIVAIMVDTIGGGSGLTDYPVVVVPQGELNIISMAGMVDVNNHLNFTYFKSHSYDSFNDQPFEVTFSEFTEIRPYFTSIGAPTEVEYIGIRPAPTAYPAIVFGVEQQLNPVGVLDVVEFPITISPNPFTALVEISVNLPIEDIHVFSIIGEKLDVQQGDGWINLQHLSVGTYFIRVFTTEGVHTEMMIKME